MNDDEAYTGCVLCTRGRFIPGPHPQKVICQIFGIIREREACGSFKGQPIAQVDPENPPQETHTP